MARIRGNNRDNTLNGTSNDDVIDGRGGNDTINGLAGDDIVNGGAGNDLIISNGGGDTLTGGDGADVFRLGTSTGDIVITDFEDGVDLIDLSAFGFDQSGSSANWWGNLVADGNDTVLEFYGINGEQFTVTLQNFHYTNIDITDYIL